MLKDTQQEQRFWLPAPPSVNELFRNSSAGDVRGGRIKTQDYQSWILHAQSELILQKPKHLPGKVKLAFFFGERSPLADCTNYLKAAEDLLVSMGVIDGDNRKVVQGVTACWVPNYSGMVVHVTPYRESEPLWLGFDDGVLGQVGGSNPGKMGLHPQALGRMNRLAGIPKPKYVPTGKPRGRPKIKI